MTSFDIHVLFPGTPDSKFPSPEDLERHFAYHRERMIRDRYKDEARIINGSIAELQKYRATLENLIQEAEKAEVLELERQYPRDEYEEYWYEIYPEHWQSVIVRHFRSSFVITAMAVFEHYLKQVCHDALFITKRETDGNTHGKGSMISKTRRCLVKDLGFTKPSEAVWQRLQEFYKVRNAIVHEYEDVRQLLGELDGLTHKHPGLRVVLKDMNDLSGLWHFALEIGPEFCDLLVNTVAHCLNDLCAEMARLCERLDV